MTDKKTTYTHMKRVPLLPRYFRWIGLALIFCFIVLSLINLLVEKQWIVISVNSFGGTSSVLDYSFPMFALVSQAGYFKIIETDMNLTLNLLSIQVGLTFIAFSRNKIEDEMINSIRLYSWSWAVISSVVFMILATLFVYDGYYLVISFHYLTILLLIYNLIFHTSIYKLSRRASREE